MQTLKKKKRKKTRLVQHLLLHLCYLSSTVKVALQAHWKAKYILVTQELWRPYFDYYHKHS